jgi:hypothetical protein
MMRVLRDNLLNNCFYIIIVLAAGARSYAKGELSLWFLWALALYRCLVFPLVKGLQSCLGNSLASVVSIFGIGCLLSRGLVNTISTAPPSYSKPIVDFMAPLLFLASEEVSHFQQYVVFYMLGLAMDKGRLREAMSSAISIFVALSFLIVGPAFKQSVLDQTNFSPIGFPYSVMWNIWYALGTFAIIACCAPVADSNNAFFQGLARLVGACGGRTLYGYYLHMLVRFTLPALWQQITMKGYGYGADVVFQILLLAAFCSPLAERCFCWLVSPQWVIDNVHAISMWASAGGSRDIQDSKQVLEKSDTRQ